jgi:tetratricopeptide (TPR) repeat protein
MFNDLPFTLTTAFDPSSLRAYPLHPLQVEGALLYLKARLHYLELPTETRVAYLTQYALLLSLNRSYAPSIAAFLEVLEIWQSPAFSEHPQQLQRLIANRIRLANTYHLQGDFEHSNAAFAALHRHSAQWSEALKQDYQHFLWQHAGKNAFDQGRFTEAKVYFEKALQFREQQQLALDLIESSRLAVSRCSE